MSLPPKPVFTDLSMGDQRSSSSEANPQEYGDGGAAANNSETTEIESLCMGCGENGITKLLLTRIPHYREVILMSFYCSHCHFQNNEVQSGGRVQEKGIQIKLLVKTVEDLSRQVVKGDSATITVPEIDLEIPPESQRGTISTVEGVLQRTIEGLTQDQVVRRGMDPEGAQQIDQFVERIGELRTMEKPFHFILRDPSGNSFVENLLAPSVDPQLEVTTFTRTKEEDHALVIYTKEEIEENNEGSGQEHEAVIEEEREDDNEGEVTNQAGHAIGKEEVLHFPTNCSNCNSPAETNMKVVDIPHFKEVVIMATNCEFCGHKTNEVKSGGGIEELGTKITLRVTDPSDLSRDVLKSETCNLKLPDLDFEMGGYSLGGKFTTLEGLLTNILEQMENNPFLGSTGIGGDSTTPEAKKRLEEFSRRFKEFIEGNTEFVFILDDPAGNSYLQNVYAPEEDPEMTIEHYKRTFDQDDDLGINDMKTENYGEEKIDKCAN